MIQHRSPWSQLTTCPSANREIKLSLSSFKLSRSQQGQKQEAEGRENSRHRYNDQNEKLQLRINPERKCQLCRKGDFKILPLLPSFERWSRCIKTHHGRKVSVQAAHEPFAKFPGTCTSQAATHAKSSRGFGALSPWDAAPLAHHPPTPPPASQTDFSKHLPSASSEQIREHAAQPSPLFLHTNPPHDSVSPRPSVTAKHPQSPQLTAGRETPNQGRRAFARGGEDGWGGGEERREGNNLLSQGKKLKLGQILH